MVPSASVLLESVGVMAATGCCSSSDINSLARWTVMSRADLRGGGGGGGGVQGVRTPLSYMKNDVMYTVIYAAFCMLPSLDLQDCTSF